MHIHMTQSGSDVPSRCCRPGETAQVCGCDLRACWLWHQGCKCSVSDASISLHVCHAACIRLYGHEPHGRPCITLHKSMHDRKGCNYLHEASIVLACHNGTDDAGYEQHGAGVSSMMQECGGSTRTSSDQGR
jgi:hypothetical protein